MLPRQHGPDTSIQGLPSERQELSDNGMRLAPQGLLLAQLLCRSDTVKSFYLFNFDQMVALCTVLRRILMFSMNSVGKIDR